MQNINIDVKTKSDGNIVFKLKYPNKVNSKINELIKRDFSEYIEGSLIIEPTTIIIDSQNIYIDTSGNDLEL